MIIIPFGNETNLSTETAVYSASWISVLNTATGDVTINLIDLRSNIVASWTMVADERLTIWKPKDYTLSANGGVGVKALPVLRSQ